MVIFATLITDCDSHSPALLDLFLSSDISILVLQWLSLYWEIAIMLLSQFPLTFHRDALFHHIAYDHSWADWDGLRYHLRDVPWENIFKLSASTVAREFREWVQIGIDVYIPYCKYQVKPHASSWFSAAFAAAIVHINHYFCLYQQNKTSESIVKFRQASNRCKRVLEAVKLVYATKTNESITSQKLGSQDFSQIANSVFNKGNCYTSSIQQRGSIVFYI